MARPTSKFALGFVCITAILVIHTTITLLYRNNFSLVPQYATPTGQQSESESSSHATGSSWTGHGTDEGHDTTLGSTLPESGFGFDLARERNSLRVHTRPTTYFRENLRNDTFYVTAWSSAGFTNQYMNYINLIYLGVLSERVPIIPPFAPADHISANGGVVPFSEVFDLARLSHNIRAPLLEWSDIKTLPSRNADASSAPQNVPVEHVGCWSTRQQNDYEPYGSPNLLKHLGLDVSYTRVPNAVRRAPDLEVDIHLRFSDVAALIYPHDPSHVLPDEEDEENEEFPLMTISALGEAGGPEKTLACFDFMYYVSSSREEYEWKRGWSPAWRFVGKYARFNDKLLDLARGYLARLFGTAESNIPPFIAVHVRRGDFMYHCRGVDIKECFAPVSAYAQRVEEVRKELWEVRGIDILPSNVLVTSGKSASNEKRQLCRACRDEGGAYHRDFFALFWQMKRTPRFGTRSGHVGGGL
ncbi:hypothetical protein AX16_006893 [Volvariella volvacea WC 439]|nr:hypothetical protein AX16_006893 [Volvariella volvacea WC 439]